MYPVITAEAIKLNEMLNKLIEMHDQFHNQRVIIRLANIPANSEQQLSYDDERALKLLTELVSASRHITRHGKITYSAPTIDTVTLWDLLEARSAETAVERIEKWCGRKYSPDITLDVIKLGKYIREQLIIADQLESMLLGSGGGGDTDEVSKAKNLLGIIQTVAELFHCTFDQAKGLPYADCIVAIGKRVDEIEKQKQEQNKKRR